MAWPAGAVGQVVRQAGALCQLNDRAGERSSPLVLEPGENVAMRGTAEAVVVLVIWVIREDVKTWVGLDVKRAETLESSRRAGQSDAALDDQICEDRTPANLIEKVALESERQRRTVKAKVSPPFPFTRDRFGLLFENDEVCFAQVGLLLGPDKVVCPAFDVFVGSLTG